MKTAFKQIYKEDGISGFWRGLWPALALVSNPIIQYTTYEKMKQFLESGKKRLTVFDYFLLGAVSKTIATLFTYPYL